MLFYNEDWIHFIWTRYRGGIPASEEALREYIYSFKGTQVTDFVMNVNATVSTAETDIFETFSDRYLLKEEHGDKVDYSDTFAKYAYELREKGIDMYQVWISALNEIGINPWLSIRMNDCHGSQGDHDIRKSKDIETFSDMHLARYRERECYFDKCLDYSRIEIRERMLAYIEEMLSRYDVYGLELDMMRNMHYFCYGFEKQGEKLMTEFIGSVYELLCKYGEKYGHKIKLSLLLPPPPETAMEMGVNIFNFTDKIDYVILIGRWQTTNTNMPIELWKQLLKETDILLGGGQQVFCRPSLDYKLVISSVKAAFGQAMANLCRGCDFVYLYNYMDLGEFEGFGENLIYKDSIKNDENRPLIFNNIGKKETIIKQNRSHVVTFCDSELYRKNSAILPLEYNENSTYVPIKIATGEISENAEVTLLLGIDREINSENIIVYANCVKCGYKGRVDLDSCVCESPCYAFSVKENLFETIIAEVKIRETCFLEYVQIDIEVKE